MGGKFDETIVGTPRDGKTRKYLIAGACAALAGLYAVAPMDFDECYVKYAKGSSDRAFKRSVARLCDDKKYWPGERMLTRTLRSYAAKTPKPAPAPKPVADTAGNSSDFPIPWDQIPANEEYEIKGN